MLTYVLHITVIDPDTQNSVDVEIFKDSESGAMVGIDNSWPREYIYSPYNKHSRLELPED